MERGWHLQVRQVADRVVRPVVRLDPAVEQQATRVGMPYVNNRWLGGMLTNFSTVHQRLERLKELEHEGIIARVVTPETPVRIEYHLTEKGEALEAVMNAIGLWAERWVEPPAVTDILIEQVVSSPLGISQP